MCSLTSKLDTKSVVHKNTFVWKKECDCAVIVSPSLKKTFLTTEATIIWELINESRNIEEINILFMNKQNINFQLSKQIVYDTLNELLEADAISFNNFLWRIQ